MTNLGPILQDRCKRCDCGGRNEILRDAVIEAARAFLAANLRAERAAYRLDPNSREEQDEYEHATFAALDALQDLRDACSAERRSR